jgi:hypothetical protein
VTAQVDCEDVQMHHDDDDYDELPGIFLYGVFGKQHKM